MSADKQCRVGHGPILGPILSHFDPHFGSSLGLILTLFWDFKRLQKGLIFLLLLASKPGLHQVRNKLRLSHTLPSSALGLDITL